MTKEQLEHIRADFPILKDKIYNKNLIYFDNAATTQKPQCVVEKIEHGYYHLNANIHRGVHYLSQKATEAHEEARTTVAKFINSNQREEIIFTRGTTEAINLVATSFGEAFCKSGDEVVISVMEHHSNIVPWQMLCEKKGMKLRVVPINDRGELNMEVFKSLLNERTKIVSIAHVSNVLGTINPIKEIIEIAHSKNVPVLIDGAQAVPHITVNVVELDADYAYAVTGWLSAVEGEQVPVGTIWMAVCNKDTVRAKEFHFPFDRERNKAMATSMGMLMIWKFINGKL